MSKGFVLGTLLGLVSGAVIVEKVQGAKKVVNKGMDIAENVIDDVVSKVSSSNSNGN